MISLGIPSLLLTSIEDMTSSKSALACLLGNKLIFIYVCNMTHQTQMSYLCMYLGWVGQLPDTLQGPNVELMLS